ncbi:helix-turn-helix domain-containing protein [Mesobacillus maritimus]|uniref:PucR family transcriptional regulator n=1 Tax=Mesobacillus maritimus TaxID=1643336 RepID=UPI00203E2359|nr:helix-turn-helix domain-containing protein [Mesobacillus maritimus]MCM3671729.1 helix-turn-helix domain-containing protein [Mesobacillus maritimus]
MLNKVQTYFENSVLLHVPPQTSFNQYYWLKENRQEPIWLGIPKGDISKEQLELLSYLYELIDPLKTSPLSGKERQWQDFLFKEGNTTPVVAGKSRLIQFQIKNADTDSAEWDKAIKEFFLDSPFIWLDSNNGIIIQEQTELDYEEQDFQSISTTLENDFFIKIVFFLGKERQSPEEIRDSFYLERDLFSQSISLLSKESIFTFEKVFPIISAVNLAPVPRKLLDLDIIPVLKEDPELLETMKVFLENNSNVSLAAKKLYIHRNTLQYRLDKFAESTGVNVKGFHQALTVYLACLLAEQSN